MEKRSSVRWLYITPTLFMVWLIGNMDKFCMSLFVTDQPFLKEMGISGNPTAIGFLFTSFTLSYAVCNFLWGFFVDRIGPRRSAIISISIWGIAMILGGISASYGFLLFSRVVLGIGEGALWSISTKFTKNWFPASERARAQSSYNYGQYIGPAIAAPLIVTFLAISGWRISFFVLAAISLVILIPMFTLLTRDTPDAHYAISSSEVNYIQQGEEKVSDHSTDSFSTVLRNYRFWLVILAFVMVGIGFFGLGSWLPSYLKSAQHFSAATMGYWTSIAWIVSIIAIFIASFLADKLHRPSLIAGIAFVLGAIAMFVSVTTQNATLSAIMISLGLATNAVGSNLAPALLQKYVPASSMGKAGGIMGGSGALIGGFAPTFIGFLIGISGGSYYSGIIFLVASAVIAAIAFFALELIDKKEKKHLKTVSHLNL